MSIRLCTNAHYAAHIFMQENTSPDSHTHTAYIFIYISASAKQKRFKEIKVERMEQCRGYIIILHSINALARIHTRLLPRWNGLDIINDVKYALWYIAALPPLCQRGIAVSPFHLPNFLIETHFSCRFQSLETLRICFLNPNVCKGAAMLYAVYSCIFLLFLRRLRLLYFVCKRDDAVWA